MNDGSFDGMTSSVRLAEHECEGQDENHIAGLIADMQCPITPIFKAGCCDERSHWPSRTPRHPPWAEHLSAGALVGHRHRVETLLEMP